MDKSKLTEQLRIAMGIDRMAKNPDFKEFLLPYLEKLAYIFPLDPKDFKKDEEYIYALKIENQRAKIFKDLVRFITSQEKTIDTIRKELEKPDKKYGV